MLALLAKDSGNFLDGALSLLPKKQSNFEKRTSLIKSIARFKLGKREN